MPAVAYARVNTPRNSLNLRKTASDSAKVLLSIPRGATIPILEKGGVWCKTTYGGYTGYEIISSTSTVMGMAMSSSPLRVITNWLLLPLVNRFLIHFQNFPKPSFTSGFTST